MNTNKYKRNYKRNEFTGSASNNITKYIEWENYNLAAEFLYYKILNSILRQIVNLINIHIARRSYASQYNFKFTLITQQNI